MDDYFTDVCDMQEVDGVAFGGGRHTGRTQRMVVAAIRAANACMGSERIYIIVSDPRSAKDINRRILECRTPMLTEHGNRALRVTGGLVSPPYGASHLDQFFWDHYAYEVASMDHIKDWRAFFCSRGLTWTWPTH